MQDRRSVVRSGFILRPGLPRAEYTALRLLQGQLDATQRELICLGIRLIVSVNKIDPGAIVGLLDAFRNSNPKQSPPLITPEGSVTQSVPPAVE
jgi:hypothetical protein